MSGILGWAAIRNRVILSSLNPDVLAMVAKAGALSAQRVWSEATTWHEAHHRFASCSPWAASAAAAVAPGSAADSIRARAASAAPARGCLEASLVMACGSFCGAPDLGAFGIGKAAG